MIRPFAAAAGLAVAVLAAGCQSGGSGSSMPNLAARPAASAVDGQWADSAGLFVATFSGGSFTSRFPQTNEVLAQGSYTVTGNNVAIQWMSAKTQQQHAASCTVTSPSRISCQQAGGGGFQMTRTG